MSETTAAPKRRYQRIAPEHLEYARNRFAQLASTSAVRAELKANGGDYSHSQLHYHWKLAAEVRKALHAAECVCHETSTRNCAQHGNAGDAQGGGE